MTRSEAVEGPSAAPERNDIGPFMRRKDADLMNGPG